MTTPPGAATPAPKAGRAGRNLPAAIGSAVVLLALVAVCLATYDGFPFVFLAIAAICVGIWELRRALVERGVVLPFEPVVVGAVVMMFGAWFGGAPPLATGLAVTALAVMLWRLRTGVDGFVRDATAGVFTAVYLPFLAGFVVLLLRTEDGVWRVLTFILVTIASDIGGYAAGVLLGRHPMSPVISPKKSWEGFAGSAVSCMVVGWLTVVHLLDGRWWVGVALGAVVVVSATLGDLCESVIKRDLGIKDMSQVIPGHGGIMDRLDSLLAAVAPTWLILYYLVDVAKTPGF
ncbi:MAG: phosphatidate cytidylyltransferase [Nocardioidaceae bacterium]|jgi:phosphatidate cytidylyltransferase|nr:phosphatidate cytidylyltransferase [Nocardioidaceae bacterium]